MSCTRPLAGWKGPDGKITFKAREGYSDLRAEVACGQCMDCRLEKSRGWAIRAVHEAQMSDDRACFLTLTFEEDPWGLDMRVWQLFAKRLRRRKGRFRFLHCGEYGERLSRPHHHALLFGIDFREDRKPYSDSKSGHRLFTSAELDEIWGHGLCFIGSVGLDSASYVARYVTKKATGPKRVTRKDERGAEWEVAPEFLSMSRRPGLGRSWFEKFHTSVYPDDTVVIEGKVLKPPRYYDGLLEERDPEMFEFVMDKRKKKVQFEDYIRRRHRESVKESRARLYATSSHH